MEFRDAPREQRNGGTFYTREAEQALINKLREQNRELLDRLAQE